VARFDSLEALEAWRTDPEHLEAQEKGRSSWFQEYWDQACSTVHEYHWTRKEATSPTSERCSWWVLRSSPALDKARSDPTNATR
jgi:hypothetical protein